jgi:hypothetical protein
MEKTNRRRAGGGFVQTSIVLQRTPLIWSLTRVSNQLFARRRAFLHTRNDWLCYDFKKRKIVPTHSIIRTNESGACGFHLKLWLIETSANGRSAASSGWRTFAGITGEGRISISAWEIFGGLLDWTADSAPPDCSFTPLAAGPVESAAAAEHSRLQAAILSD